MIEYALRGAPIRGAQPGRLYASHPTFSTYCEAIRASAYFPDVPLLVRHSSGAWEFLVYNESGLGVSGA